MTLVVCGGMCMIIGFDLLPVIKDCICICKKACEQNTFIFKHKVSKDWSIRLF